MPENEREQERLRKLARALDLRFDQVTRIGSEGNMAGIQSEQLLFSHRLDSRTYFVQDQRFGMGRELGSFEGPDDALTERAVNIMERMEIPVNEIDEKSILREQTRVAEVDQQSGAVSMEAVQEGKKLAILTRQFERLPVWSSKLILGLTRDGQIGFLELHWPDIPVEIVDQARKHAALVEQGWRPPELPDAKVESVEAGILHSPALGFVMDIYPAIRVIYAPVDPTIGRKPTLYLDADGKEVPIPRQFEKLEEEPAEPRPEQPAPPDVIRRGRSHFKALLLANPNYFGNLPESSFEPQLPIKLDTFFEEIGCVGYEPQLRRLEAVVYVKQETGYGGDVCSAGTPEFVRFYLSADNGVTWQDQGMVSFTAYNIAGSKPLEYDLTLQIDPDQTFCTTENLLLARAILSWNNPPPPNDPGFNPIWGEVQDAQIQIAPRHWFSLGDLFKEVELQLPKKLQQVVELEQTVPAAKAKTLSAVEIHELYKKTKVPGHRYLYPEIQKFVAQPHLTLTPASVGTGFKSALAELLDIDLVSIVDTLLATDGNTSFEELHCVGLNPVEEALVGVLTVKLSSGYSGGLCTAGSKEYVAFWIDTGAGWTYAGTTSVTVHDLSSIPPGGIQYAVFLPVDLSAHRRPCEQGAVTARVRAILSWQTPPPPGNPDYVPTWGNREETLIQIKSGPSVDGQVPFLSAVGDIPEIFIGASGKANGSTIHTGFVASDSPFGGVITIAGKIANASSGLKYRVMRKPHLAPDSAYAPLTNEPAGLALIINTWDSVNGWVQTPTTVHADIDGYYPYEDYSSNHAVDGNIMGRWFSTMGEDGQTFDLRIDLSTDGNPAHDVHSNVVTVLIDNTAPDAKLSIDLGTGVQCADFDTGTTFIGTFTATDAHFKHFHFRIQPSGPPNDPPHGVLPAPPSGSSIFYGGGITDPGISGDAYTLNTGANPGPPATGPMDACGYALILHVYDRTNVDSGKAHHHSQASVGFCLKAPE